MPEAFKAGELEGAASKYAEAVADLGGPSGAGVVSAAAAAAAEGGDVSEGRAAAALLVTCLVNLATCQLRQERAYEAIASADAAIALDEAHGKAWFRRGQACMALTQYAAARRNLSRAAQLLPSSRGVRDEYAKCQELAQQKKEAAVFELS